MINAIKILITIGFIALIAATKFSRRITCKNGERITWLEYLGNFFLANIALSLFVWVAMLGKNHFYIEIRKMRTLNE